MYSSDHCPFCLRSLDEEEGGHYYCGNDCDSGYNIISFTGGSFSVSFYVEDYRFQVTNVRTTMTDFNLSGSRIKVLTIDEPMIVNHQNKSQVLERIKKLKAFA